MASWYENPILWYCIMVLIVGFVTLAIVYNLGKYLVQRNILDVQDRWPGLLEVLLGYYEKINFRTNLPRHLIEANAEFLQRRNEFWTTYLQVVVAVLIIIILAILLITKSISPESGLPILSAVSGFAIAKSVTTNRSDRQDNDRNQQG